jgi:hypothetical protein
VSVLLSLAIAAGGLHGVVTRGPIQPVCRVGVPCSEPAVGARLAFSRAGKLVASVRVGAGGRYAIRLQAGVYTVRVVPATRIGGVKPQQVLVRRGVDVRINFAIDTGIR